MRFDYPLRRAWRWYKKPFVTHVYYHNDTRIETRQWPYKLKVSRCEPLQTQVSNAIQKGGGIVRVTGTHLLTQPLVLWGPGVTLKGQP